MMSIRNLLAVAAVAIIATGGAFWVNEREDEENEAEESVESAPTAAALAAAQVSDDSARVLALLEVPGGKITEGGLETEDGKLLYSFDIAVPGKEGVEEIHIDAMTGALLRREHETDESEAAEKAKESPKKSGR